MTAVELANGSTRRAVLIRRVRWLVAFTITYNAIEGVVAILAGANAGSGALIGFGLDSVIEMSSALAILWQFARTDHEARERIALRVIAISFFALAIFVTVDAMRILLDGRAPAQSPVGILVAASSLLIMPVVSFAQRRTGSELGSASAVADSRQTLLCTLMSAVLLGGLLANLLLGWWAADPVAAMAIAGLALREGALAWRGEACCTPTLPASAPERACSCCG